MTLVTGGAQQGSAEKPRIDIPGQYRVADVLGGQSSAGGRWKR